MSLVSLFTRTDPSLGVGELAVHFDAVLEQVVSKSVDITEFPVEFGANANDHRIIQPVRYTLVGAISNNPIRLSLDNLPGTLLGSAVGSIGGRAGAVGTGIAGVINAAFLAGSSGTRSSSAWATLTDLMNQGEPFDVQVGDETIPSMIIARLDRRRVPQNENGLEFIAELRQLSIIQTQTVALGQIQSAAQLRQNDPIATQAAPVDSRGLVVGLPQ